MIPILPGILGAAIALANGSATGSKAATPKSPAAISVTPAPNPKSPVTPATPRSAFQPWFGLAPYPGARASDELAVREIRRVAARFASARSTPTISVQAYTTSDPLPLVIEHFRKLLGGNPAPRPGYVLLNDIRAIFPGVAPEPVRGFLQRLNNKPAPRRPAYVTGQLDDPRGATEFVLESPVLAPNRELSRILATPLRLASAADWRAADATFKNETSITLIRYSRKN